MTALIDTQTDMAVVGEAATGEEGLTLCLALLPDVALVDLRLPGMDGIGMTVEMRKRVPSVRVLIVTVSDTEADRRLAAKAGAAGYLRKSALRKRLLPAIRSAYAGDKAGWQSSTK